MTLPSPDARTFGSDGRFLFCAQCRIRSPLKLSMPVSRPALLGARMRWPDHVPAIWGIAATAPGKATTALTAVAAWSALSPALCANAEVLSAAAFGSLSCDPKGGAALGFCDDVLAGTTNELQLFQQQTRTRQPVGAAAAAGEVAGAQSDGLQTVAEESRTMYAVQGALPLGSVDGNAAADATLEPVKLEQLLDLGGASMYATASTTQRPVLGVRRNTSNDFASLLSSLPLNFISCAMLIGIFCYLRNIFPMLFQNNCIQGFAPFAVGSRWNAWFSVIPDCTTEAVAECVGLDTALLLEFCDMAKVMMITLGVPAVFVLGPLHAVLGGGDAGDDWLNRTSMANVTTGSSLYFAHAVFVWFVVIASTTIIHGRQEKFLGMRMDWIRTMPDLRACTVLVENIPQDYRTDSALKAFFESIFPGKVKSAYVVRDTSDLVPLWENLQRSMQQREEAEYALNTTGDRPTLRLASTESEVDKIRYFEKEIDDFRKNIFTMRRHILEAAAHAGAGPMSNGFVAFRDRQDAQAAIHFQYFADQELCMLRQPPCSSDICWRGMATDIYTCRWYCRRGPHHRSGGCILAGRGHHHRRCESRQRLGPFSACVASLRADDGVDRHGGFLADDLTVHPKNFHAGEEQ